MSCAVSVRAGEQLRIGSARIRFQRPTQLLVDAPAGFLVGCQVLASADGGSRLHQLHRALEDACLGEPPARQEALRRAIALADQYVLQECPGQEVPRELALVVGDARGGRLRLALAALRAMLDRQDAAWPT